MREALKKRHEDFWNRRNETPLIGFSPGSYFVSCRYDAAKPLLQNNSEVSPDMLNPSDYMADYDRIYLQSDDIGGDTFYTPEPFTGIPWVEAIAGLEVFSGKNSFHAKQAKGVFGGEAVNLAWFEKYLDFCRAICQHGNGRYSCGQPILRGPADLLGTALGQESLIFEMIDSSEETVKTLKKCLSLLEEILEKTYETAGRVFGGTALGFYNLWCPGTGIWFQDDFTSIMSPALYEEILEPIHRKLSGFADYTMMHLHTTSAYVIDYLLDMEDLSAIQLNRDIGEVWREDTIPLLEKIQSKKNLVLWGDFTKDEVNLFTDKLQPEGLYIIVHGANWNGVMER